MKMLLERYNPVTILRKKKKQISANLKLLFSHFFFHNMIIITINHVLTYFAYAL